MPLAAPRILEASDCAVSRSEYASRERGDDERRSRTRTQIETLLNRTEPLQEPRPANVRLLKSVLGTAQQWYTGHTSAWGRASPSNPLLLPDGKNLTEDDLGLAFELALTHTSQQRRVSTEGSRWFGIDTLQAPLDAVALQEAIFQLKPDLVIEIGTECGGSAIFIGELLRLLGPANVTRAAAGAAWSVGESAQASAQTSAHEQDSLAVPRRLLTYDVVPRWQRGGGCKWRRGVHSALWKRLVRDGILEPRTADVTTVEERRRIAAYARSAGTVLIIDDGDHFATSVVLHFELLAHHVTPGSYYLVEDTRLDRVCAVGRQLRQPLHRRFNVSMRWSHWPYCLSITGPEGGPARAVRYLQCESATFRAGFEADRSMEKWLLTQHPGGWLRRVT